MRTTIVYHKDGSKSVIPGKRIFEPSYESIIDTPQGETILNLYKTLESEGAIRGWEKTKRGAEFIKRVWANG